MIDHKSFVFEFSFLRNKKDQRKKFTITRHHKSFINIFHALNSLALNVIITSQSWLNGIFHLLPWLIFASFLSGTIKYLSHETLLIDLVLQIELRIEQYPSTQCFYFTLNIKSNSFHWGAMTSRSLHKQNGLAKWREKSLK